MKTKRNCGEINGGLMILMVAGLFIGLTIFCLIAAHYESVTYNRLTGARTTWWDALWVELRIQDQPQPRPTATPRLINTGQWHREEEAKIDAAVAVLESLGKWDDHWDKFSKLGDYGWRDLMDCSDDGGLPIPCMSGGYTFSQEAFEQVKRGDLSHNAHNSVEESFKSQKALIEGRQK